MGITIREVMTLASVVLSLTKTAVKLERLMTDLMFSRTVSEFCIVLRRLGLMDKSIVKLTCPL